MPDPFACFGDSSSSSSSSGGSEAEGGGCDDDTRLKRASDLAEGGRLKDKSNADPVALTPINDDASFEMFDAGPSGMGLRATAPYKRGDEVLRECAAMRVPNKQAASSREEAERKHLACVARVYDKMHPSTQSSFMELSSCQEGIKTKAGVYDTNSFQLGCDDSHGGLFLTLARINHSCRPNVVHCWRPGLQQTLVLALRDIEIGEELFTIYGPSECMDTKGRRDYLHDRFAFNCTCEMCTEGNVNGGDERMLEIQSIQNEISSLVSIADMSTTKAAAALSSVKRCLGLMDEQGIGGGAFSKSLLHSAYELCLALDNNHAAREYLSKELTAVRDSEGIGCPKASAIERVLDSITVV